MKPGWTTVTLGEVVKMDRVGVQPADIPEQTPYLGLENIESGGEIKNYQIIGPSSVASVKYTFTPRHLLYGKLRPYLRKIAIPDRSGVCSTDIIPILPSSKLDISFLRHYLDQPSNIALINSLTTGANLPRISPAQLRSIQIPLPPIEEQRRIAAILDRAHALRERSRSSIQVFNNLRQQAFIHYVRNCPETAKNDVYIRDVISKRPGSIRTGPFGSQLLHSEFTQEGIAVLGIDNVVNNEFQWVQRRYVTPEKYAKLKKYTVYPGDVLITIMGTCGRCAIVPDNIPAAINTKHLCALTLDQTICLPKFLQASFLWQPATRDFLMSSSKGAIMDGLNMGIIKSTPLTLLPMNRQREIIQILDHIDAYKCHTEITQTHLDALFASLQARAFAGEL